MRSRLLITFSGLSLTAMIGFAEAQVIEPLVPVPPLPASPEAPPQPGQPLIVGKTVTDRARPELDPLGVPLGNFFLFPRVELDEGYNDNIFATPTSKTSAWLTQLQPSFDLLSNFPQNQIELSGGAALGRYSSHSSENYDDAFGALSGRWDVSALQSLSAGLRVDRLHEPRTSPDSPGNAATPVRYTTYTGNLGFAQNRTRIGYELDGIVTRSEYEAPDKIGGGTVPQDDRNDIGIEGAGRVYYEFEPGYQAFIRASGNNQSFDHAAGPTVISTAPVTVVNIPRRNSSGYRADVGARIDLTGVTYADLYGGYLEQDYESSFFTTIRGIDYGAQVVWNATTLDTVKLNATRTVNNANTEVTGIAVSPGYLASIQSVSIDHELLRNLLLNANAGYEVDDWKGIDRTDDIVSFGAGAKYLMTRNLYFGATWQYEHRISSGAQQGLPFSQNVFLLRISTQI